MKLKAATTTFLLLYFLKYKNNNNGKAKKIKQMRYGRVRIEHIRSKEIKTGTEKGEGGHIIIAIWNSRIRAQLCIFRAKNQLITFWMKIVFLESAYKLTERQQNGKK